MQLLLRKNKFLFQTHIIKIFFLTLVLFLYSCSSNPITDALKDPNPFEYTELLLDAEQTIESLINADGHGIPEELLSHAKAFVVFPNLYKAAIFAGARVGKRNYCSAFSKNRAMEPTCIY